MNHLDFFNTEANTALLNPVSVFCNNHIEVLGQGTVNKTWLDFIPS